MSVVYAKSLDDDIGSIERKSNSSSEFFQWVDDNTRL